MSTILLNKLAREPQNIAFSRLCTSLLFLSCLLDLFARGFHVLRSLGTSSQNSTNKSFSVSSTAGRGSLHLALTKHSGADKYVNVM